MQNNNKEDFFKTLSEIIDDIGTRNKLINGVISMLKQVAR